MRFSAIVTNRTDWRRWTRIVAFGDLASLAYTQCKLLLNFETGFCNLTQITYNYYPLS